MGQNVEQVKTTISERLEVAAAERIKQAVMAAHSKDDAQIEQASLSNLVAREHEDVLKNMWRLHDRQWHRFTIGRAVGRMLGKKPLFLGYEFDEDMVNLPVSPDAIISTPPLLTERVSDSDQNLTVGWSFRTRADLPEMMVGGAPLQAYLRPLPAGSTSIDVVRVTSDSDENVVKKEEVYSVFPWSGDGFVSLETPLEDVLAALSGKEMSPEAAERDEAQKYRALGLGIVVNRMLRTGFLEPN